MRNPTDKTPLAVDVATHHALTPTDLMLNLPSGTVRARRHGSANVPLALGVPGISANAMTFELVGEGLARQGSAMAALDLRGRGRSPAGKHGTHGWENHARDVLDAATALGAEQFDYVGHSMGAFIGLVLANLAPQRLRRLVLIDAVGIPDPRAMPPILAAVNRIGTKHESVDAFLAKVKAAGIVPWNTFWEAHYREDLVEVPGGVAQRASNEAVMEDLVYGSRQLGIRSLWPGVKAPTLLIRASLPLAPGGDIVTPADRDQFLVTAPNATGMEVPANHYGVMHHKNTLAAVAEFLK